MEQAVRPVVAGVVQEDDERDVDEQLERAQVVARLVKVQERQEEDRQEDALVGEGVAEALPPDGRREGLLGLELVGARPALLVQVGAEEDGGPHADVVGRPEGGDVIPLELHGVRRSSRSRGQRSC